MVNEPIVPTAELMPRREPGLIERIFMAITRANPAMGPQPDQQATTQSGVLPQLMQQLFGQYFTSPHDRLAIYKDVEEMDSVAEEVSTALDVMTNNVNTSEDGTQMNFDVSCDDATVKGILDDTTTKADLHRMIRPWTRGTIKYGDSFVEVLVNAEFDVVGVKMLPPNSLYRNQDTAGNLLLGKPNYDLQSNACLNKMRECAYEQRSEDNRQIVAAFRPWQIVHSRLNWDGVDIYGKSMFRVTRIIWKKIHALEEALIVGRLTRAFLKLVFHIDTTGLGPKEKDSAVTKFRESIISRRKMDGQRENPFWVLSDIFMPSGYMRVPGSATPMPSLSKVEMLDPKNEGMTNIDDLKYLHRKYLSTIRVPPAHIGFEEDVNSKATLGWQDVNYIRLVRDLQGLMGQALEQVYDTALVLKGYDPQKVEYTIKWPVLSATDEAVQAASEFQRAQADEIYQAAGAIDAEWIQEKRLGMTEEDIEEIGGRIDKAKQDELQQQQATVDDAHGKALELQDQRLKGMAALRPGTNGNGKSADAIKQEIIKELARPVTNGGKGHHIGKGVGMLAEAIASGAHTKLAVDLDRIFAEQKDARHDVQTMVKEITAEKPSQLPLVAPAPPSVHVNLGRTDIHAEVHPAPVNPTPVSVAAPHVENKIEVQAAKAPDVKVENKIDVPAQKPPTVVVQPSVTAPEVHVTNEVKTPEVHVEVQAPQVTVQQPEGDVEIQRDDRGNVTGAKRVPKKKGG